MGRVVKTGKQTCLGLLSPLIGALWSFINLPINFVNRNDNHSESFNYSFEKPDCSYDTLK